MDERSLPPSTVHGRTSRRRVWRILLYVLCITVALLAITAFLIYRAAGSAPAWYVQPDPQAASQPARDGENKIIQVQTWAGTRYAYDYAQANGHRPLVNEPESTLTLTFTDEEVNALLQKWFDIYGRERVGNRRMMEILRTPMVHFQHDRVTLAAAVADAGFRVLSIDLRPQLLPDGTLDLQLLAARSGTVPLPESAWSEPREMLLDGIRKSLPQLLREATIDKGGGANPQAVSAIAAQQAADTLNHRPTDNILFLPIISDGLGLPVELQGLDLQDGSLTFTLRSLTPDQRQSLLSRLRQ